MKIAVALGAIALALALNSWYMYNVVFYGSLPQGGSILEVLMTASSTITLQKISIFSQWPIVVPFNATQSNRL